MIQMLMLCGNYMKMKARQFFSEEKGAVDIIAIVVLIAIVVVLAIVFKDQIANLVETLFKGIAEDVQEIDKKPDIEVDWGGT